MGGARRDQSEVALGVKFTHVPKGAGRIPAARCTVSGAAEQFQEMARPSAVPTGRTPDSETRGVLAHLLPGQGL